MSFWELFLRVLCYRPLDALSALYWQLTRRKVRARNRLRRASIDLPFAYGMWIRTVERKSRQADFRERIDAWTRHPVVAILLYAPAGSSTEQIEQSASSVSRQAYPFWTLLEIPTDDLTAALPEISGDYVLPLRAGDLLSETALFYLAEALQQEPDAAIVYGDQDELDDDGARRRPWFKPSWNEELFLAQDYLSDVVAFERKAFQTAAKVAGGEVSQLLVAVAFGAKGAIAHVPHILLHAQPRPRNDDSSARLEAIDRYLKRQGAVCRAGPYGTVRIEWPLPSPLPLVTIIVPTKDKLELLAACVDSVLERTRYDQFEILIVDNGSVEKRTADYLKAIQTNPRVRVLFYDREYNFSAINNFAARNARGAYLCLLNNDTEVLEADWLTELMRYAVRPRIGAAGAKLLYEDGSIQHAGVVVGIGDAAGHAHRFLKGNDEGYFRMAHVAQFVSAVTAACLVVDKRKFMAVGGLDEEHLRVAFNDVDFCLKLEAAGWRNVYVPHAVLLHHESKSRGQDSWPVNVERYRRELKFLQDRWGTKTYRDPLHNPNLDRYSETFIFGL